MADRPIDRLLPTALALVFGTTAAAAGLAGVVADVTIGRPSSTSGVGLVLMFPLVILSAVVGFATGHMIGSVLRRRGFAPLVPMRLYRVVMAIVLGLAMVIGAIIGGRPVIRHERLHQPRVIAGEGALSREETRPEACILAASYVACDSSLRITSNTLPWNGRDVVVGCTREGRVSVSDASGGIVASVDLTEFDHVRRVHARAVRHAEGREALVLLGSVRARGNRHMFVMIDSDGRVIYQELLAGELPPPQESPLSVCELDERQSVVVDLGSPITYRPK